MTTHAIPAHPANDHMHNHASPSEDRRSAEPPRTDAAPGPTAGLVALPDPDETASRATAHAYLRQAETARQRQLDLLPTTDRGPVMAAYRRTVTGILAAIRAAIRRTEVGLYGVCSTCDTAISRERLADRPWATTCDWCAPDEH